MPATVLYLSFDGMTDPLGRSQVLPYLTGLATHDRLIRIVSLEKADALSASRHSVAAVCGDAGLQWCPSPYRTSPPLVSAAANLRTLRRAAERLYGERPADLLHCRSYPAAVVGLRLKRRSGSPLVFDMRGFWPDQRRDGGRWRDGSLVGRSLFRRWKRYEVELISEADHIVVLTNAAKKVIEGWDSYRGTPISVIPCFADFGVFNISSAAERMEVRHELGFGTADPLLVYLGSVGTVYRLQVHLRLFDAIRRRNARTRMLFVGRTGVGAIISEAARMGVALDPGEFRIVCAAREDVGRWVSAGDAGTCFCTPTFSSLGVSPTKLGEYLACGIPVIANSQVGDVEQVLGAVAGGHTIANFDDEEIERAADKFLELRDLDRQALRERARPMLDLPRGIDAYRRIYADLKTPVMAGPT